MKPTQSPEGTQTQTASEKKQFETPKLTYISPKLKKEGKVSDMTLQTFFGPFSP